jgi:CubicO group peptidase (beta-lactamase class C family)
MFSLSSAHIDRPQNSMDWVGVLVERASGLKLSQYFKKYILEPLGITNTGFFLTDHMRENLISVYQRQKDGTADITDNPMRSSILAETEQEQDRVFNAGGHGCFAQPAEYARTYLASPVPYPTALVFSSPLFNLLTRNPRHAPQQRHVALDERADPLARERRPPVREPAPAMARLCTQSRRRPAALGPGQLRRARDLPAGRQSAAGLGVCRVPDPGAGRDGPRRRHRVLVWRVQPVLVV